MFKRWLAVLGAAILLFCTSQLLWGGGGGGDGEDHPWNQAAGGGGTGSTTVRPEASTQTSYPFTRIYIVRPAPMGGFYLTWISLSSDASVKTAAGVKKAGN